LNITQSILPVSNRVRNQKVELSYSQELINGLFGKVTLHYSDRKSIENIKYPAYWDSLNLTFGAAPSQPFERYKIMLATFDFEYHFKSVHAQIAKINRVTIISNDINFLIHSKDQTI
jgi:hypothetical protein